MGGLHEGTKEERESLRSPRQEESAQSGETPPLRSAPRPKQIKESIKQIKEELEESIRSRFDEIEKTLK